MTTSAKPNSSQSNHTDSWRSQKPRVLPEKCIGCALCSKLCPDACIYMEGGEDKENIAKIDYPYCKGCGLCAAECPVKAIIMEEEE